MKHTRIEKRPLLTKTIHRNRRTKKLCAPGDEEAEALVVPTKRVRFVDGRLYGVCEHTHVVDGHVINLLGDHVVRLAPRTGEPMPAPLFDAADRGV